MKRNGQVIFEGHIDWIAVFKKFNKKNKKKI